MRLGPYNSAVTERALDPRRALFPGTFDPVTRGHVDVAQRAARVFDELVVGVATNADKRPLLGAEERIELLRATLPGLRVVPVAGLVVDACRDLDLGTIVRGVRSAVDVEYELQMARTNAELAGVETVFVGASPRYAHVTSTLVRQIARLGGDVAAFVPEVVARRLADAAES